MSHKVCLHLGNNHFSPRHCACCFKDAKNFVRFDNLVQSIVVSSFAMLQEMIVSDDNNSNAPKLFKCWTTEEQDKLLFLNSKVFQLNFPLYVAYKQLNISKNDELTPREVKILSNYCDLTDFEIPTYLLRKIFYFLENDGFVLFAKCFEQASLSLCAAQSLISFIQNIKNFFRPLAIGSKLTTLRSSVIHYLCNIQDDDLRVMNNRSTFETIWTAVRDVGFNLGVDKEGLRVVLKFFSSSTLTMRLSAIGQITTYINSYESHANSGSKFVLVFLIL